MAPRSSLVRKDDEKELQLQVSTDDFDGDTLSDIGILNKALKITGMWFIDLTFTCHCSKNQIRKCDEYMIIFQSLIITILSILLMIILLIGNYSSVLNSFKWNKNVNSWVVILSCICSVSIRIFIQYYFAKIRNKSQFVWNYSNVQQTVQLSKQNFEHYIKFLKTFFCVFSIIAWMSVTLGCILSAIDKYSNKSDREFAAIICGALMTTVVIMILIFIPFYIIFTAQFAIVLKYQLKLNELIELIIHLHKSMFDMRLNMNCTDWQRL